MYVHLFVNNLSQIANLENCSLLSSSLLSSLFLSLSVLSEKYVRITDTSNHFGLDTKFDFLYARATCIHA